MSVLIGQIDGKKVRTYISVKDAWKLYGYKEQYLRRLLRQKKLARTKIGQVWLIEVSSLENYLSSSHKSKDRRCGPRTKKITRPRTSA
jgi:helix-turn-helix protein